MHRHNRIFVAAIAALNASAWLAADTATQPTSQPTSQAATRTERDEIADVLAFERAFVIDAYRRDGHRDATWDADALALLDAQVRAARSDAADRFYKLPDAMPAADRATLAQRVIDAGCDDAIVLYEAGCALRAAATAARDAARRTATVSFGPGNLPTGFPGFPGATSDASTSAGEAFAAAARVAGASKYVPLYQFMIARDAIDGGALAASPAALAAAQTLLASSLKAALADPATLPAHRLPVWIVGRDAFVPEDEDHARSLATGELIDGVVGGDPWLYNLTLGEIEIDRAWHDRGNDTADGVTDAGWKGFHAHLAAASAHLKAAIEADDAWPQPFSQMIVVAMGEGSDTERAWFEHAVARQVDYRPAMRKYAYALEPKWGGTPLAMFEEGVRAVDTGRFDTRRPAMLLDLLKTINDDEPLDARQIARVYPQVARCLDGYIAQAPLDEVKRWARSTRAAWAAHAGRWAEANEQFVALAAARQAVDPTAFYDFNLRSDAVAAEAAARGGPRAAEIAAAMAKPIAERPVALDALLKGLAADDVARPWVARRLTDAQLAAALAAGDWAPLPIVPDLAGWTTGGDAKWTVEADGSLVCGPSAGPAPRVAAAAPTSLPTDPNAHGNALLEMDRAARKRGPTGTLITAPFEMPQAFDLRFTVAPLAPFAGKTAPPTGVAPTGTQGGINLSDGWIILQPGTGKGFVNGQGGGRFAAPENADGSVTITLQVRNASIAVIGADGKPLIKAGGAESVFRDANGHVQGTVEMGPGGFIIRDESGRLVTMPTPAGGMMGAPEMPGEPAANTRRLTFGYHDAIVHAGWRFSHIQIRAGK